MNPYTLHTLSYLLPLFITLSINLIINFCWGDGRGVSIKGVPGRYANFHLRATVTRMKRASRAEPSSHPHSSADPAGVANSSGAACLADDSAAPRGPARRRVSVKAVDDLQFFKGTVIRFNYYREGNRHYRYDDGVEDWEDLSLNGWDPHGTFFRRGGDQLQLKSRRHPQ